MLIDFTTLYVLLKLKYSVPNIFWTQVNCKYNKLWILFCEMFVLILPEFLQPKCADLWFRMQKCELDMLHQKLHV